MSRSFGLAVWGSAAIFGLWGEFLVAVPAVAAAPPVQDAVIQAQIDAGEFAPALAAARQIRPPRQRDAWLARIAAAQAQAGARDASLQSASQISDDRTRTQTLSDTAAQPLGGRGGGAQADFDSLIDLITSTVAPTTWDTVGGPGSVAPFPTGVWVDPQGVLRPLLQEETDGSLAMLHKASGPRGRHDSVRRNSTLRKISLPRLEKQVQLRLATGQQPTEAMQVLAGLQRIKYVLIYPESGDLVLAGPAGDWKIGPESLVVSADTGKPVVRLDDLVVILRHMMGSPEAKFGCLITPRQEALARVQEFVKQPGVNLQRAQDRKRFRSQLGEQDIEVYGLDPKTRAARVIVEADYRMKLVGMGLEEGVPGVESYLARIKVAPGKAPPPMGVLRWWFTLNYDAILASHDRLAFGVRGQGIKVLSENERLTAEGKRVHTGESETLNQDFARSFTEHFEELCAKYPIYAELRNDCDLALAASLVRQEGLAEKVGWHMTCFGSGGAYQVELGPAPKTVETVVNHRIIRSGNQVHVVVGVSGGVRVDPASLVNRQAIQTETYGSLQRQHSSAVPKQLPDNAWWWD